MRMNEKYRSVFGIVLIVIFFIVSSYFVQKYLVEISSMIGKSFFGMLIYVGVVIIAIVIAPVSMVPLIPLASGVWGWFFSAILNIVGWTIGAVIAFYLARKYGVPLVEKFIPLERIHAAEKLVPKGNVFWSVVFLRMSVPVDILSYALGLFSKISLRRYVLATVIGVTPFAFVFAYMGTVSFYYQVSALLIALLIFAFGVLVFLRKKKK